MFIPSFISKYVLRERNQKIEKRNSIAPGKDINMQDGKPRS